MKPSLVEYWKELDRIENSLAIVRYCLSEQVLSDRRLHQFFKQYVDARVREIRPYAPPGISGLALEDVLGKYRKYLARQHGPQERDLYRKELVHDWLGRSELLLLVAAFEHWLKDYYWLLVVAEPRRAFSKSKTTVTLAEVFGGDAFAALAKSPFFQRQLKAEVERFDHTNVKDRLKNMADRYQLDLKETEAIRIHELVELRHNISHKLFRAGAVTAVSPKDLDDARRLFRRIPGSLLDQARKKHPRSGLFDS